MIALRHLMGLLSIFAVFMAHGQRSGLTLNLGLPLKTGSFQHAEGLNLFTGLGYHYKFLSSRIFVEPEFAYMRSNVSQPPVGLTFDTEILNLGSRFGYYLDFVDCKCGLDIYATAYWSRLVYWDNFHLEGTKRLNTIGYGGGVRPFFQLNEKLRLFLNGQYLAFSDALRTPEVDIAIGWVGAWPESVKVSFFVFSIGTTYNFD